MVTDRPGVFLLKKRHPVAVRTDPVVSVDRVVLALVARRYCLDERGLDDTLDLLGPREDGVDLPRHPVQERALLPENGLLAEVRNEVEEV